MGTVGEHGFSLKLAGPTLFLSGWSSVVRGTNYIKHSVGEGVPLADLTHSLLLQMRAQQANYTELVLLTGHGFILLTML